MTTQPVTCVHGELDCADTEAILADVTADNARLYVENASLQRRLDIAIGRKNLAIDEAVEFRSLV